MIRYPLRVEAHRDEPLSRWLWLVKWLLLVPHYLALLVLWTGLVVLTLVAYLTVLLTGRYPAPIRSYNLGVLRWSWRVGYYGYQALGTDAYPPFTLADVPDYPARLSLAPAEPVPRWLPLVAWLFAVPHLIILAAVNGTVGWSTGDGGTGTPGPISVIGALVLTAAVALLFTGHHPRGLYDLLIGVARWSLRVAAYLCLLTPRYPPLRLDQGDSEPDGPPDHPVSGPPSGQARQRSATGSVVALVAGVLLLVPAAAAGIGGGVLLTLDARRDSTGYVTSPDVRLETATAAITAEHLTITDATLWSRRFGNGGGMRVTATSSMGGIVFAGIAPQPAVDAWLTGTAHDELVGMNPDRARYVRAAGTVRSAGAPADQNFWLVQATGPGAVTVQWDVTDGEYAVVIANPDGTPGVTADVTGAIHVPGLGRLGTGLVLAGVLLLLTAVASIVLGGTGLGHRHSDGPPPAGPRTPAPPVLSTPPVAARP